MRFLARSWATIAARALCVVGLLCASGSAPAQMADPPADSPAIKALTNNATMQKGIAAAHRGDFHGAASYFLEAARHGNPLAQVVVGQLYFEGRGLHKNNLQALQWLKLVIARNQEPTRSMAAGLLQNISASLNSSPDQRDRMLGLAASLLPLTANPYAQQWNRNMEKTIIVPCYVC